MINFNLERKYIKNLKLRYIGYAVSTAKRAFCGANPCLKDLQC